MDGLEVEVLRRFRETSLALVAALSVDARRSGLRRGVLVSFVVSLHEEGVSDTKLCVSSKPSSFNSCVMAFVATVTGPLILKSLR